MFQPGPLFAEKNAARTKAQGEAIMAATSIEDLFERLERCEQLFRLNKDIEPTMYRCATVSMPEFEELKKIENIVRMGKVICIEPERVTLEQGSYTPAPNTVFIDCTADGLGTQAGRAVFEKEQINLQPLRFCQQVFSAALIAHIESSYDDDKTKNDLCIPVPHPNHPIDHLINAQLTHLNSVKWQSEPKIAKWLSEARLDMFHAMMPPLPEDAGERHAVMKGIAMKRQAVYEKLDKLLRAQPEWKAERAWTTERAQL